MPKGEDKKRKRGKSKREMYKVAGDKLERLQQFCPKCGPGVFLAKHSDRVSCGRCGYSELQRKT